MPSFRKSNSACSATLRSFCRFCPQNRRTATINIKECRSKLVALSTECPGRPDMILKRLFSRGPIGTPAQISAWRAGLSCTENHRRPVDIDHLQIDTGRKSEGWALFGNPAGGGQELPRGESGTRNQAVGSVINVNNRHVAEAADGLATQS
ncbi:hypothetical protein HPP92_028911 [Vanilla planifolia]|uniref:Uncharacterized protein n=1 Tax=Vanilla planifolia TaxID=51239 RepID=A0A835P4D5_VANPL|nr:hypothetical protein HPP92_028911 [Vanilla planifolia]KAG0446314.1 hypothetical protein HPP92_028901 [Vanilla planifolia]